MACTLKLDWTHYRAADVADVLAKAKLARLAKDNDLAHLAAGQPGDGMTLKLEWSAADINKARAAFRAEVMRLESAMLDARDSRPGAGRYEDLVCRQAQICMALHDTESYLSASESLSAVSREALAKMPL